MEQLERILNEITNDYGIKILEDSQRFKAVFADYAKGGFAGEKELFIKVIENGAAKEIKEAEDLPTTKKALIRKLHQKYFLDESICSNYIDIFITVLRKDYVPVKHARSEKSKTKKITETNKPKPQVIKKDNKIKTKEKCQNCGKVQTSKDINFCTKCGQQKNKQVNKNGNDFVVRGKYTLDDFVQYNGVVVKKNSKRIIIPAIISIAFSIFIIAIGSIWFGIFLLIFDLIFFPALYRVQISRARCKKVFDNDRLNKEEQTFTINKNIIQIDSASMNLKLDKNQITEILFDYDSIYIMVGSNEGFIIKERYCQSKQEFATLRHYLLCYK